MYSCWGKLMIQLTENQSDNYVGCKGRSTGHLATTPRCKCMNLHSKDKKGGNRHRDVGVMCR